MAFNDCLMDCGCWRRAWTGGLAVAIGRMLCRVEYKLAYVFSGLNGGCMKCCVSSLRPVHSRQG